jgi:ERCC4-type nuclease
MSSTPVRLDKRAGSADLLDSMVRAGVPVELDLLPYGDIEITGRGPAGRPLIVLTEYKKLHDVLACVRDGRFAEQLRGMRTRGEVNWLLIEGEWRIGPGGALEVRERRGWETRAGHTYQEVVSWLLTMTQRAGVLLHHTATEQESVAWLRSLYWWWTSKDFEDHQAHLDWYKPPYTAENPFDLKGPSVVQKVAAALLAQGATVDVGGERAKAVAAHFGTVRAMLDATALDWQAVPGIGPKIAKKLVEVTR